MKPKGLTKKIFDLNSIKGTASNIVLKRLLGVFWNAFKVLRTWDGCNLDRARKFFQLVLTKILIDRLKYFHQAVLFKHIVKDVDFKESDVGMCSTLRCHGY